MRQDNPPRNPRRMPKSRPSRYQFSTADLPYRPLRLTRQRVVMPDTPEASAGAFWRRLALIAVILGFGAVWLHGGAARQVLSWVRQAVAVEDAGKRLAQETGE